MNEINTLPVSVHKHENKKRFGLIGTHEDATRNRGNLRNTGERIRTGQQNITLFGPKTGTNPFLI